MKTKASHPLFPAEGPDQDPPEIISIHIARAGSGTCPHAWEPDELTSLEQIDEMFGGGTYTLTARDHAHFSARRTVTLPGPSKPLNLYGDEPPQAAAPQPAPGVPGAPMGEGILLAVLRMMQEASANQTTMLMAMMKDKEAGARESLAMIQTINQNAMAQQTQGFTQLLQIATAGKDKPGELDAFMKGVSHAREFIGDGDEDDGDEDDIIADAVDAATKIAQTMGAGARANPPPGTPANPGNSRPAPPAPAAPPQRQAPAHQEPEA